MIFASSYDNNDNDSLKHVLFNKNFKIFIKKRILLCRYMIL